LSFFYESKIWSLYFDGSKSKEGASAVCMLFDPKGSKIIITCRLEFRCTKNGIEYEALIEGLCKALYFGVEFLKFYGDSEVIVRHVRNSIHFFLAHLKAY